jgi:hypothetical protein
MSGEFVVLVEQLGAIGKKADETTKKLAAVADKAKDAREAQKDVVEVSPRGREMTSASSLANELGKLS